MATLVVLGIYLILTVFAMFYRADFLSLTICTMGIYIIDNPQNCDRGTFRLLVAAIVVSWVYDILYLWVRSASFPRGVVEHFTCRKQPQINARSSETLLHQA